MSKKQYLHKIMLFLIKNRGCMIHTTAVESRVNFHIAFWAIENVNGLWLECSQRNINPSNSTLLSSLSVNQRSDRERDGLYFSVTINYNNIKCQNMNISVLFYLQATVFIRSIKENVQTSCCSFRCCVFD